jgi:hypothetical protein
MIDKKSWEEFKSSGLLWFVNRSLHIFGWALVFEVDKGKVKNVYPARVKFRGFTEDVEDAGFKNISGYLKENAKEIYEEAYLEEVDGHTTTGQTAKPDSGNRE